MKKILLFVGLIVSLQGFGQRLYPVPNVRDTATLSYPKVGVDTSGFKFESTSPARIKFREMFYFDGTTAASKACDTCKWVIEGDPNVAFNMLMQAYEKESADAKKYHELRRKVYEVLTRGYNKAPNDRLKENL